MDIKRYTKNCRTLKELQLKTYETYLCDTIAELGDKSVADELSVTIFGFARPLSYLLPSVSQWTTRCGSNDELRFGFFGSGDALHDFNSRQILLENIIAKELSQELYTIVDDMFVSCSDNEYDRIVEQLHKMYSIFSTSTQSTYCDALREWDDTDSDIKRNTLYKFVWNFLSLLRPAFWAANCVSKTTNFLLNPYLEIKENKLPFLKKDDNAKSKHAQIRLLYLEWLIQMDKKGLLRDLYGGCKTAIILSEHKFNND
jgi:hypothetical protein